MTTSSTPEPRPPQLVPNLGLYTAAAVVIGSMIGSGIFKKSAVMAGYLHSPGWLLATWALAGLITCSGALANAEVAGMFPAAGGQYVYFRRIYNDFVGFIYGWAVFAVIQSGSIASIAYVFAEYLGYFVDLTRFDLATPGPSIHLFGPVTMTPLSNLGLKLLTVGIIAALTGVNMLGVALGGAIASIFTTLKVLAVGGMVALTFTLGDGSAQNFVDPGGVVPSLTAGGLWATVAGVGMALAGAFWSYDGWNNVTFLAGEVRNPTRNIPRALGLGTATVVGVYLLVNLAYLYMLPVAEMAGSKLVAADVMKRVMGHTGGALLSGLVVLSTFGSTNGSILASARVSYAMARDGLFFSALGKVHPRYRTPVTALLVQGIWSSALVFSGSFDQLTDMLIFVSWIFYALAAAGVFVLRRKMPDEPRPYRVWGYPFTPALFVAFAASFVIVTLVQNPRDTLLGLALLAPGVALYFRYRKVAA